MTHILAEDHLRTDFYVLYFTVGMVIIKWRITFIILMHCENDVTILI